MINKNRILSTLIIVAFISMSCRFVSELSGGELEGSAQPTPFTVNPDTPVPPTLPPASEVQPTSEPETTEAAQVTAVTEQPTPGPEVPLAGGYPPQTNAAIIQPKEQREELTLLTNLLGFQAIDYYGAPIGTVTDYVVNTCETYIIYFLVDPVEVLKPASGHLSVIPFEAVTINSGVIDANTQSIQLHMTADKIIDAPTFPEAMHLVPTAWEEGVRNYWSQYFRLSNLKTECLVAQPSSSSSEKMAVYKVAYATHLIGAQLQDGLQKPLGLVVEAALEPESGKLGFFVVQLQNGELLMIPLSAVNIPEWALEPGSQTTLVLLKETDMLVNAPSINSIEEASDAAAQQTARNYWAQ